MKTVGEKIKDLRKERKISQEELSFELKVSRQTIHKWEKNIMQPNADSIRSLCNYFEIQADYFFKDSNSDIEIQNGLAISEDRNAHIDKVKLLLIVLCAFIFVLFVISLFFAICFGLASNSDNIGFDNVASLSIDSTLFVAFLVLSIILLALNICVIIYILKRKCK